MLDDDVREARRLASWWAELEPKKRHSAIKRRPSDPMPIWMLTSLRAAGVSGLDDQSAGRADVVPPWVPMPDHVVHFLALVGPNCQLPEETSDTGCASRASATAMS